MQASIVHEGEHLAGDDQGAQQGGGPLHGRVLGAVGDDRQHDHGEGEADDDVRQDDGRERPIGRRLASDVALRGGQPDQDVGDHPADVHRVAGVVRAGLGEPGVDAVGHGHRQQADAQEHEGVAAETPGAGEGRDDQDGDDHVARRVGEGDGLAEEIAGAMTEHRSEHGDPADEDERHGHDDTVDHGADTLGRRAGRPQAEQPGGHERHGQEVAGVGRRRERDRPVRSELVGGPHRLAHRPGPEAAGEQHPPPAVRARHPPRLGGGGRRRGRGDGERRQVVHPDHGLVAAGLSEHDRAEGERDQQAERGGQTMAVVVHGASSPKSALRSEI